MRLHPREKIVTAAQIDLRQAVIDWMGQHEDLTWGETFAVLGAVLGGEISSVAKYLIREERHGDQDKPGGLE